MIGKKARSEPAFHYFDMGDLVPEDHMLKLIDKHIDFSFIRPMVEHLYSARGRTSVDPEIMVRMMLVGYLFGIESERRLCQDVAMHIGYRWFCKLSMEDAVPNHSTFSKNRRGRFNGNGLWEGIFDEVVRQCITAGLVRGKHVTVDGTLVQADASLNSMEPIVVGMDARDYLKKLDAANASEKKRKEDDGMNGEYTGKGEKMSNATHRSATDPDSRIARKKLCSEAKLSYQVGVVMDNASRVILDAAVTNRCGRAGEAELALGGLDRMKWKHKLKAKTVGADKGYATGEFIRQVYQRGATPHVPVWDTRAERERDIFAADKFTYDRGGDCYICPQGILLNHKRNNLNQRVYRASQKDCGACPLKPQCTRDKSRSLSFHMDIEYIEKAKNEKSTSSYRISQRNRKKVEELFGESKEQMGMRRMNLRGLVMVAEQIFMTSAAQNIKRLVKFLGKRPRKPQQTAQMTPEKAIECSNYGLFPGFGRSLIIFQFVFSTL